MEQPFAIREISVSTGGTAFVLVHGDTGAIVEGQTGFVLRTHKSGLTTVSVRLKLKRLHVWHDGEA